MNDLLMLYLSQCLPGLVYKLSDCYLKILPGREIYLFIDINSAKAGNPTFLPFSAPHLIMTYIIFFFLITDLSVLLYIFVFLMI